MSKYASPTLECDLVMKGGITSGVIYPRAIASLAERYRLRNIGGASAGAIAAVAAGAAEYGRDAGSEAKGIGFEGLADLPSKLTESVGSPGKPRLLSLFQPMDAVRPAFEILLTAIAKLTVQQKVVAILRAMLRNTNAAAVVVVSLAVVAALVVCAALTGTVGTWVAAILGAVPIVALGLAAAATVFLRDTLRALGPEGGYGMCPGYAQSGHSAGEPPLTAWLAEMLNDLAGTAGQGPITFGDLAKKEIALALMTTDLTNGRPYRLPFAESDRGKYFFSEGEFRALFPREVVDVMVSGAKALLDASKNARTEKEQRLFAVWSKATNRTDQLPFPDADSLPLVVGARLSLSFPVLLQAVPLYSIDFTRKANQDGIAELERCWFSDGGICSNLPIHFFDALLPGRPTFALNLKFPHPDHPVEIPDSDFKFKPGKSELNNVWLPKNNTGGVSEAWNRFDRPGGKVPLLSFLTTIVDTMQCWNDNFIMHYPGYRDRVVHISHTKEEGGLNLDMPEEIIVRLANRGEAAGEVLKTRFDPATGDGWRNHLWVRCRTLLAMLAGESSSLGRSVSSELTAVMDDPPSYKFDSNAQEANAKTVTAILGDLSAKLESMPSVADGAPRPRAVLKGRPQSG